MRKTDADTAEEAARPAQARPDPGPPLRWGRALAVGLPLIVLNTGWVANSELRAGVTEVTISSLFMGVTFLLFLVTLLNLVVRRRWGARAALSQPELMVLYTMLSLSSAVCGVGHFGFFLPFLANAFYYATPENGWRAFWHLLPPYIGPRDPAILRGFYEGHSSIFAPGVVSAWALPLALWCVFFLALLWTTLCLAAILRRRWADEEHLPFPVIALPLEMTREGAPLYSQKLLWVGFAIPAVLFSLNSLQSVYPALPSLKFNMLHDMVADAQFPYPWTGMGTLFYLLHPCGVGFGYLISTDVSFSLWFFYLLRKVVDVWATSLDWRDPALGWFSDNNGQFPYFSYQGWGAWLILGLATLWTGRAYVGGYLRRALHGDREGVDLAEPMSARVAVCGFLLGFLALCAFVWFCGGSWWLPVVFLLIYVLIMVTLSRIRAETAVVSTELIWVNPQSILPDIIGAGNFSRLDLAHMGALSWFNLDYRGAGMPHEMEGLVGLGRAGGRLRPMVPVILLAAAVAMVSTLLWDLQVYYVNGAATGHVFWWRTSKGSEPWNNLQGWLQNPHPPHAAGIGGMVFGAGVTLALTALRARFVGFPLHPAAYALNTSFANDFYWCDMFVAWLLKSLILRYGGMGLYRKGLPLFLGLILGDFVTGSAWSIAGTLLHVNLYRTFPV